jgi:ribonuclease-3
LVNEKSLSQVARRIHLGPALRLGKGEERNGGRDKDSILSDAFEALVASVYVSNGIEAARKLIIETMREDIEAVSEVCSLHDYKSTLQEYTLKTFKAMPRYTLVEEEGPDHHKIFRSKVNVQNKVMGVGQGRSKKESEQFAAQHALKQLEERKAS